MQTHLLLSDTGGVLQFDDGLVERFLHLFHLFTVPEQNKWEKYMKPFHSGTIYNYKLIQVYWAMCGLHMQLFYEVYLSLTYMFHYMYYVLTIMLNIPLFFQI